MTKDDFVIMGLGLEPELLRLKLRLSDYLDSIGTLSSKAKSECMESLSARIIRLIGFVSYNEYINIERMLTDIHQSQEDILTLEFYSDFMKYTENLGT